MTDLSKLTTFQFRLLCHLAGKYEPDVTSLREEYNRRHEESVEYWRVYYGLERLVELEYVRKEPIDGRANCYMLTNAGADVLRQHRDFVLDLTETVAGVTG